MSNMVKTLALLMALFFIGCSQRDYESMYYENFTPCETHPKSFAQGNYEAVKNGENPMKRPSYDEYRAKQKDKR